MESLPVHQYGPEPRYSASRGRRLLQALGWLVLGLAIAWVLLPHGHVGLLDERSGRLRKERVDFGISWRSRDQPSEFYELFGRALGAGMASRWRPLYYSVTWWPLPNFRNAGVVSGLRAFVGACRSGSIPAAEQDRLAKVVWEAMQRQEAVDVDIESSRGRLLLRYSKQVLAEWTMGSSGLAPPCVDRLSGCRGELLPHRSLPLLRPLPFPPRLKVIGTSHPYMSRTLRTSVARKREKEARITSPQTSSSRSTNPP